MASVGLGLFTNPAPYHLLAYGTLLGTQVHQTFLVGTTGYRALDRPAFRALQSALFPLYFAMQSTLPVVLAATYPGNNTLPGSFQGVVAAENTLTVLAPLTTMLAAGVTNYLFVGPWTTRIMLRRVEQEKKDGKKVTDPGPHSPDMQRLTADFGKAHGISTLLNLAAVWASAWYAFGLGARIL